MAWKWKARYCIPQPRGMYIDPPGRLEQGLFLGFAGACSNGTAASVTFPDGTVHIPTFCGQPIGSVVSQIIQFQDQYQAAVINAGPATNQNYIGNILADNFNTSTALLAPDYV